MLDRKQAKRILAVAMGMAEGYRDSINVFSTAHETVINEACSTAAHNTAFFILKEFGFSNEQIAELKAEVDHGAA